MPKLGMEPFRRNQVMSACLACLADGGLEKLTLDQVAARAKVSKGVVNYYFQGKKDLLLSSLKALLEIYMTRVMARIDETTPPWEMLEAILDAVLGDFDHPSDRFPADPSDPGKFDRIRFDFSQAPRLMIQFMSLAMDDDDFSRIFIGVQEKYLSGTVAVFSYGLESGPRVETDPFKAAYGLGAMLEGFWAHRSIG